MHCYCYFPYDLHTSRARASLSLRSSRTLTHTHAHTHTHTHTHTHQADSREGYATRLKLMQTIDQLHKKDTHSVDVIATTSTDQGLPPCDEACASSSPGCIACYWGEDMYPQYQSLMHSSKFGWHVGGDTDSSNRLYDIISSGAVPFVIGEGMRESLPFDDLPWDEMVAVAHAEEVTTVDGLQRWLAKEESLAPKRLEALQAHGPAVLWHLAASDVALRVLKEARSKAAGREASQKAGGGEVCDQPGTPPVQERVSAFRSLPEDSPVFRTGQVPEAPSFFLHDEGAHDWKADEEQLWSRTPFSEHMAPEEAEHEGSLFLLQALRAHPRRTRNSSAAGVHVSAALLCKSGLDWNVARRQQGDDKVTPRLDAIADNFKAEDSAFRSGKPFLFLTECGRGERLIFSHAKLRAALHGGNLVIVTADNSFLLQPGYAHYEAEWGRGWTPPEGHPEWNTPPWCAPPDP